MAYPDNLFAVLVLNLRFGSFASVSEHCLANLSSRVQTLSSIKTLFKAVGAAIQETMYIYYFARKLNSNHLTSLPNDGDFHNKEMNQM